MTKHRESVIFLPRTEAPTTTGWFYGSPVASYRTPEPLRVHRTIGRQAYLYVEIRGDMRSLTEFDWFGPLPKVAIARTDNIERTHQ